MCLLWAAILKFNEEKTRFYQDLVIVAESTRARSRETAALTVLDVDDIRTWALGLSRPFLYVFMFFMSLSVPHANQLVFLVYDFCCSGVSPC